MVCFSTLCLQVGHRLGFWGGFSCFVSFIWCQLFACLIRAAIFRLPPSFVVWSFFLCPGHLWLVLSFFATGICVHPLSFTAFSAVGIRVRLCACLRVSVYLSIFGIMLCACRSSDVMTMPHLSWRNHNGFLWQKVFSWNRQVFDCGTLMAHYLLTSPVGRPRYTPSRSLRSSFHMAEVFRKAGQENTFRNDWVQSNW